MRKAGSTLRRHHAGESTEEEAFEARRILREYRHLFQAPMEADGVALTRVVTDHSIDAEVTQRLKRENTIYEKITQWGSGLDLSRMRDIGGCRVVLAHDDLKDLYVLVDWARKEWSECTVIDYIQRPRVSGYRAIHLIVNQDGFLIEVQLRTQTMHQWASDAEAFSALFGENYKQDGDSVIQEFLRLRALLEHTPDDAHEAVDVSTFTALAQKVRSMLKGLPNESEEVNDE